MSDVVEPTLECNLITFYIEDNADIISAHSRNARLNGSISKFVGWKVYSAIPTMKKQLGDKGIVVRQVHVFRSFKTNRFWRVYEFRPIDEVS